MTDLSTRTLKGYESDFRVFTGWFNGPWQEASERDVLAWLQHEQAIGKARKTITRYVSSLRYTFEDAGIFPNPITHPSVKEWLSRLPDEPIHRPGQLTYAEMFVVVDAIPDDLMGIRDKAIILVGWWGRLERAALVGLHCDDVRPRNGNKWEIRPRAKHRQTKPRSGIRDDQLDVIDAKEQWCEVADIKQGLLFPGTSGAGSISCQTVNRRIKARIAAALPEKYYSSNTLAYGPADLG